MFQNIEARSVSANAVSQPLSGRSGPFDKLLKFCPRFLSDGRHLYDESFRMNRHYSLTCLSKSCSWFLAAVPARAQKGDDSPAPLLRFEVVSIESGRPGAVLQDMRITFPPGRMEAVKGERPSENQSPRAAIQIGGIMRILLIATLARVLIQEIVM